MPKPEAFNHFLRQALRAYMQRAMFIVPLIQPPNKLLPFPRVHFPLYAPGS